MITIGTISNYEIDDEASIVIIAKRAKGYGGESKYILNILLSIIPLILYFIEFSGTDIFEEN